MNTLSEQFDEMFEKMQTPESREAMDRAYHATPEELGNNAMRRKRNSNSHERVVGVVF